MLKNIIRIIIVLCTIGTGCLLPKKAFINYLPVTLFSSVCQLFVILYLTTHKLWKMNGGQKSTICNSSILIVGPYFIANLWVFVLSKGKLLRYSLINLIADFIYAFPLIALFRKLNFFKLKISSTKFLMIIISNALLNFAFHKFYEKSKVKVKASNPLG